jgi:hypothetical protein
VPCISDSLFRKAEAMVSMPPGLDGLELTLKDVRTQVDRRRRLEDLDDDVTGAETSRVGARV